LYFDIGMPSSSSSSSSMSSKSAATLDTIETYTDGSLAAFFKPSGEGFIYYPSGKVAGVVSNLNSYQNRYYFYDNDKQNSVLVGIDENAVGFVLTHKKDSKKRLVLTYKLATLTDDEGNIIVSGNWQAPPSGFNHPGPFEKYGDLNIEINKNLFFSMKSRRDMKIKFVYDNFSKDFDVSMKLRRYDSYMDNAKYNPATHQLDIPLQSHKSLIRRTDDFTRNMKAFRNKLNPKSKDLSLCKSIVADLEKVFDNYHNTCSKAVPFMRGDWKGDSEKMSRRELPQILRTGKERGNFPGFSTSIYLDADRVKREGLEKVRTYSIRKTLLNEKGSWRNDLEIRLALLEENPLLPRTSVLNDTSGRYTRNLIIPGGRRTAKNPTGMTEAPGTSIPDLPIKDIDSFIRGSTMGESLMTVFLYRLDDPVCSHVLRELENFQTFLNKQSNINEVVKKSKNPEVDTSKEDKNNKSPKSNTNYKLTKADLSRSPAIAKFFNCWSVPCFFMYYKGQLVKRTTLGGNPYRSIPSYNAHALKILFVEPNAKFQLIGELAMKREHCKWNLCMKGSEAVAMRSSGPYDIILMSDQLSSGCIREIERCYCNNNTPSNEKPLLCGMANLSGDEGRWRMEIANWRQGVTRDVKRLFKDPCISEVVSLGITSPVKQFSLQGLLRVKEDRFLGYDVKMSMTRTIKTGGNKPVVLDEEFVGVTEGKLLKSMQEAKALGMKGKFLNGTNFESERNKLSMMCTEMTVRGADLKKTKIAQPNAPKAF